MKHATRALVAQAIITLAIITLVFFGLVVASHATTDTSKFIDGKHVYNNSVCRGKFELPFYESEDVHERVILRDALKDCMDYNSRERKKEWKRKTK